MLLKRIEIRNVRKIKQADVDFHGPGLQVIEGANKSGKSTFAQSIALTLEGTKAFTPGMIKQGEEQAEIIAFTDDGLQIKTSIKGSVKQTVSRLDETAGRYVNVSGGVREFLNSIRSGLEMPWALRSMTDAQIIEVLKNRAGVADKILEIDNQIKAKELARTDIGRDKKKLGELGQPPEQKEHPPKIDDLKAEREKAVEYLKWYEAALQTAGDMIRSKCNFSDHRQIGALSEEVKKLADEVAFQAEKGPVYTRSDVDGMDKRFMDWNKEEEKAKTWDAYLAKRRVIDQLAGQYDALTAEIEALRGKRKKALADITLIKGLEVGDDNKLYHNGVPRGITESNTTDNWSTAESVQVFFSLGAAFGGQMKVLVVDNAESMDGETTKAISVWAEKSAFLVILLKVADMPEELEEEIIYLKEGEVVTK